MGAWAWGNDGTFGSGIDAAEIKPVFDAAMNAGLKLVLRRGARVGHVRHLQEHALDELPKDIRRIKEKCRINRY